MIKTVNEIKKGDMVVYRSGRINYVNKPRRYKEYFNEDFQNPALGFRYDIIEIKRYVKILGFYKLKTIYKRK